MTRIYLEEDLHLIKKYFPGATAVALHTPFDSVTWGLHSCNMPEQFRDSNPETTRCWTQDISWLC